jgi:hypothetical protein
LEILVKIIFRLYKITKKPLKIKLIKIQNFNEKINNSFFLVHKVKLPKLSRTNSKPNRMREPTKRDILEYRTELVLSNRIDISMIFMKNSKSANSCLIRIGSVRFGKRFGSRVSLQVIKNKNRIPLYFLILFYVKTKI